MALDDVINSDDTQLTPATLAPGERLYVSPGYAAPSSDPENTQVPVQSNTRLAQALAPQPTLMDQIAAIKDKLLGTGGQQRYQTWPERMVKEGVTSAGDIAKPNPYPEGSEEWDWYEDMRSKAMVPGALAISALAGGGALTERPGVATLGSGPIRKAAMTKIKDYPKTFEGRDELLAAEHIPDEDKADWIVQHFNDPKDIRGNYDELYDDALMEVHAAKIKEVFHVKDAAHADQLLDAMKDKLGQLSSGKLTKLNSDTQQPAAAIAALKSPAPVFYSALEHAATNAAQDTMSPQQWLGYLKNQPGVKKEELDWSGLEGWLGAQKGKVKKEDVQSYLDAHKTEIKDITKSSNDTPNLEPMREAFMEEHGREPTEHELRDYAEDEFGSGSTKYSSYQLPGGENYREHLLTLPNKSKEELEAAYQLVFKQHDKLEQKLIKQWKKDRNIDGPVTIDQNMEMKNFLGSHPELSSLNARAMELAKQTHVDTMGYRSSHWDEPNVLAHVRTNDREFPAFVDRTGMRDLETVDAEMDALHPRLDAYAKQHPKFDPFKDQWPADIRKEYETLLAERNKIKDADEKTLKSLHIEEIQSDWHQQGRKQGYNNEVQNKNNLKRQLEEAQNRGDEEAEHRVQQQLLEGGHGGGNIGVPDAPFKSSWPELALKRMIRHAAENGYDRISWTPGEAQAARYDLSKQVHSIRAIRREANNNYNIAIKAKGNDNFTGTGPLDVREEDLANYVGKDLADKIRLENLRRGQHGKIYSGLDLKVGGEGMREFYDKMLPKMAEKIGKSHGVKVKVGKLPNEPEYVVKGADGGEFARFKTKAEGDEWIATMNKHGADYKKMRLEEVPSGHDVHYFDLPQSLKDVALHKGFPLYMTGVPFPLVPVDHDPFKKDK